MKAARPDVAQVVFVIGLDHARHGLCSLSDLCQVLGNAAVTCGSPVAFVASTSVPEAMAAAADESGHGSVRLALPWLSLKSQQQLVSELGSCEPWWYCAGDAKTGAAKLKLISQQLQQAPLLRQLMADTSGHPHLLILLVEIMVAYLMEHPGIVRLADANVEEVRNALRDRLNAKFASASSGRAVGLYFKFVELMTILAHTVGHVTVGKLQELVPGFTVERLQSYGVVYYEDRECPTATTGVALKTPFLVLQVWVRYLRAWIAGLKKGETSADTPTPTASRNLLSCLNEWFALEEEAACSAASWTSMSEVFGPLFADIRANAECVAAEREDASQPHPLDREAVMGPALAAVRAQVSVAPRRVDCLVETLDQCTPTPAPAPVPAPAPAPVPVE